MIISRDIRSLQINIGDYIIVHYIFFNYFAQDWGMLGDRLRCATIPEKLASKNLVLIYFR